jgi:methanogenic corrinoid protein MtbC1
MSKNEKITLFLNKLISLDKIGAKEILSSNTDEKSILKSAEQIITPALERIGDGWEKGVYSLSQIYMSSRLCEDLVDEVLPHSSPERIRQPEMAIAILDDYHGLGKTIVYSALRAGGFALDDYGRCSAEELSSKIIKNNIKIILISTLMLRSALMIKNVKDLLNDSKMNTRIIVGGAPFRFDPELAREVGADAMGTSGLEAVKTVTHIMEDFV